MSDLVIYYWDISILGLVLVLTLLILGVEYSFQAIHISLQTQFQATTYRGEMVCG